MVLKLNKRHIMKKAIITFTGTAGTRFSDGKYLLTNRASYYYNDKIFEEYNTLPLLIKEHKDYDIIALFTKDSKQVQKIVLEEDNISYNFENKFFINDVNNNKDIFRIINNILREYESVIFDVSHGFRNLPIIAIINIIIENIKESNKIDKILFAQEQIRNKDYKIIDLRNYLDMANIAFAIRSFLSTFKVPELDIDSKFYNALKEFSIHLTSNQFKDIFEKDIKNLKIIIEEKKEELQFINTQMDELLKLISNIEDKENSENYQKFTFFSNLFLEKEYFLHSSSYLIEGITLYISETLKAIKLYNGNPYDYNDQQKVLSFVKGVIDKKIFNLPNPYFFDINYESIKKFDELRERAANIRHNLAHINLNRNYKNLDTNIKSIIDDFKSLVIKGELSRLNYKDDDRKLTIKYLLENIKDDIDDIGTNIGIEKLIEKHDNNSIIDLQLKPEIKNNLIKFADKYIEYIKSIINIGKDKRLLTQEELENIQAKIKPDEPKKIVVKRIKKLQKKEVLIKKEL
jgi:hypothetical protein